MLTVLGGLAEFERHLILARTSEGRQRAQQRGVRFGRKLKLTSHQRQEALRASGGEALVDIARAMRSRTQRSLGFWRMAEHCREGEGVAVLSWPQSIPIVGCFSCSSPLLGPSHHRAALFFLAGA